MQHGAAWSFSRSGACSVNAQVCGRCSLGLVLAFVVQNVLRSPLVRIADSYFFRSFCSCSLQELAAGVAGRCAVFLERGAVVARAGRAKVLPWWLQLLERGVSVAEQNVLRYRFGWLQCGSVVIAFAEQDVLRYQLLWCIAGVLGIGVSLPELSAAAARSGAYILERGACGAARSGAHFLEWLLVLAEQDVLRYRRWWLHCWNVVLASPSRTS